MSVPVLDSTSTQTSEIITGDGDDFDIGEDDIEVAESGKKVIRRVISDGEEQEIPKRLAEKSKIVELERFPEELGPRTSTVVVEEAGVPGQVIEVNPGSSGDTYMDVDD